jgi:hypothetical protein
MWQSKFGSKIDKIKNPFSKRSIPLWCPKSKNIIIMLNDTLSCKFFQISKVPKLNNFVFTREAN